MVIRQGRVRFTRLYDLLDGAIKRTRKIGLIDSRDDRPGKGRERRQKKNQQAQHGRSLACADKEPARAVEALEEEKRCGAMKKPADKAKNQVDGQKDGDKGNGLDNEWRKLAYGRREESGCGFIVSRPDHETGNQPQQRKSFPKEAFKKTP
jgi:hypothetical protein